MFLNDTHAVLEIHLFTQSAEHAQQLVDVITDTLSGATVRKSEALQVKLMCSAGLVTSAHAKGCGRLFYVLLFYVVTLRTEGYTGNLVGMTVLTIVRLS